MMGMRRTALAASLLLLAAGQGALADPAYPRLVGGAEEMRVEYEPGAPAGNVVGGGAATLRVGENGKANMEYLDPHFAQRPLEGRVPVLTGGQDGLSVVYLDQPAAPVHRAARPAAPRG
ncbi:hypothetical protein [Rubritepida flocculans]|uniref:hypothetical protein n=1 Tax=Rubritepida flocculans TaxID=182403 RepID=UPI00040C8438|nr:hypothetical protein [Rubritepida flocculans]